MDVKATSTTTTAAAADGKTGAETTAQTSGAKDATTTAKADGAKSMLDGADQQTGETKAGDTKTAADTKTTAEGDKKTETKTDAKPVLVDDKWEPKAVEGLTRDAKGVFGKARELFSKLGFTQEQAQALVDFSDAQAAESSKAAATMLEEQKATRRAEHFKALESDKELGGAKLEATKADYHRAIRALGGKELADALKSEGLENWPPLVKALTKAGRALAEDTVTDTTKDGGKAVGDPFQRHLRAAYPRMFNKES
jgi:hypothetical protein